MASTGILLQVIWTSLSGSGFLVLLTLAFALVLKVLKIWDFTQPAVMAAAFYAMYCCNIVLGLPPFVGFFAALVLSVGIMTGIERFAFRTLRARESEPIAFFIFTLIFAQFVAFLLSLIFTSQPLFMLPDMMSPVHFVDGVVVSDWDLMSIGVSAAAALALVAILRLTRLGQHLIAVADNPELSEAFGIDPARSYLWTMATAATLITVATFLFGAKLTLYPTLPASLMIFAVAATILGGMGNVFAAGLAAVAISLLQQVSVLVISSRWQPLVVFGLLFVAIICFPTGVRWPRGRLVTRGGDAASLADSRGG
jgi:branched-subunit amino acid ABC-type transport system permease component